MGNNFYPRPPRGGRRKIEKAYAITDAFLSTPSARRATSLTPSLRRPKRHFYPRPPRGGRRKNHVLVYRVLLISIHALREEGDPVVKCSHARGAKFHALREEGDSVLSVLWGLVGYFYPRPPRGGRPYAIGDLVAYNEFLSTPSARRATAQSQLSSPSHVFLSTPSARRATWGMGQIQIAQAISIHALREEGDVTVPAPESFKDEFLSTPSARRATCKASFSFTARINFYPRPPRGGRQHTKAPLPAVR